MDDGEPGSLRPQQTALSERSDGRRVGAGSRPLIPPAKRGGNKRTVVVREVMNGLMYILSTGCQWARDPEGPAADEHGERLFPPLGLTMARSTHPPCALC